MLYKRPQTKALVILVGALLGIHEVTCWTSPPAIQQKYRSQTLSPLFSRHNKPIDKTQERNNLLDNLVKTKAEAPVIFQWKPARFSILRRFRGTILETAIVPSLWFTLLSVLVCIVAKRADILPGIGMQFNESRIRVALSRLDNLWHMHLTVLSFFLAFYLNTAKDTYDKTLKATRGVQGRLNDMNLIAASHAKRDKEGKMIAESKEIVENVSRYSRLFVVLFYSSIANRYKSLLDTEGLEGMKKRGMVTEEEAEILLELTPKARYNAPLQWIGSTFARGCQPTPAEPSMRMEKNVHFAFVIKLQDLRSTAATIMDMTDTRCPLAYVHLVQLFVDTFLILTPFAAIADMGWFSIPATFTLSFFFTGLMNLSKQLLDPLNNNDDFGTADNINLDALIQESNNGSQRFALTAAVLPYGARQTP